MCDKPLCGEDEFVVYFSICDWAGYPEWAPAPEGPFTFVAGQEYEAAKKMKNNANRTLHRQGNLIGM